VEENMKKIIIVILTLICSISAATIVSFANVDDNIMKIEYNRNIEEKLNAEIISPSSKTIYSSSILLSIKADNGAKYKAGVFVNDDFTENKTAFNSTIGELMINTASAESIKANSNITTSAVENYIFNIKEKIDFAKAIEDGKNLVYETEVISAESEINFLTEEIAELNENNYIIVLETYKEDGTVDSVTNKRFSIEKPISTPALKLQPVTTMAVPIKETKQNFFQTIFRSIFGE